MKDKELIDNPDFNKKLDEAHQQLLMDEEFQQMRTSLLRSLDKEKIHLLHKNDQDYIKEYQSSPELNNKITQQYQKWIKNTPKKNKESFFFHIMKHFSFDNHFGFTLSNIGLVVVGLLLGVLIASQWELLFSPYDTSGFKRYSNNNELFSRSKIEKMKNGYPEQNRDTEISIGNMLEALTSSQHSKLTDSVSSIQETAKMGNPNAQAFLGWMYEKGYQIKQNDELAVQWYKKAALQSDTFAQNNLGKMYQKGWGVQKSEQQAMHWFSQAAEQGYAEAQYNLARIYQKGSHEQNIEQIEKWLNKAAKQGYQRAQYVLDQISTDKSSSNNPN